MNILEPGQEQIKLLFDRSHFPILERWNLLDSVLTEYVKDQLIADPSFITKADQHIEAVECTVDRELRSLAGSIGIDNSVSLPEAELSEKMVQFGVPFASKKAAIYRAQMIELWAELEFSPLKDSLYIKYKEPLTSISYTLLRSSSEEIVQECYCKILNDESTLEELALRLSEGPESSSAGCLGPLCVHEMDPLIAGLLLNSPVHQVQKPQKIDRWWVILRVNSIHPLQLDDQTMKKIYSIELSSKVREAAQQMKSTLLSK